MEEAELWSSSPFCQEAKPPNVWSKAIDEKTNAFHSRLGMLERDGECWIKIWNPKRPGFPIFKSIIQRWNDKVLSTHNALHCVSWHSNFGSGPKKTISAKWHGLHYFEKKHISWKWMSSSWTLWLPKKKVETTAAFMPSSNHQIIKLKPIKSVPQGAGLDDQDGAFHAQ